MSKEMIELAEELREFTAMKYAGDCKCGKCQLVPRKLVERIYHTLNGAALRASAVAEPVAWRTHHVDDPADYWSYHEFPLPSTEHEQQQPLYAHPAPAAPVPASVREALEEIASWKHDTLGQRPREPGYWATEKELNAFDRGVRMAFYRCSDRASAALASLPAPEAAPSDIERAFQDACDEAGCAYDNEALLEAISALKQAAAPTREEIMSVLINEASDTLSEDEIGEQAERQTDALRALKSAAPTREDLLQRARQFIADSGCDEDDSEVNTARDELLAEIDAILALKAAPAKASHVALGSDMDDGQRGRDRE